MGWDEPIKAPRRTRLSELYEEREHLARETEYNARAIEVAEKAEQQRLRECEQWRRLREMEASA